MLDSNLISVSEAAKKLGISSSRIRRRLRSRAIQGQQIGRQWFVDARYFRTAEDGSTRAISRRETIDEISASVAIRLATQEPRERRKYNFELDLADREGTLFASLTVDITNSENDGYTGVTYPEGLVVSAERGGHGADLHLDWDETKLLRDALSRLLREAGKE